MSHIGTFSIDRMLFMPPDGMEVPDDVRAGYSGQTAPYARRSRLRPDIWRYPTPSC